MAQDRVSLYWYLAGAISILLVPGDMLTTVFAAKKYGTGPEINPLTAWALESGWEVLVLINIIAVIGVFLLFYAMIKSIEISSGRDKYILSRMYEVWGGFLLLVGVFVITNNLAAIFFEISLVPVELIKILGGL